MKPRIVLATDSPDPSGLGEHMLTLGAALSVDFDIVVAAPQEAAGAGLLYAAAERGLGIKSIDPGQLEPFRQWLGVCCPDLVHVHAGIGWEGHGLVRTARGAGVPVVRTEHLPYLLTNVVQQAEYRAMLLSVDSRIAVSRAVAESYVGRGRGRVHVVPNGITTRPPVTDRDALRSSLGVSRDEKLILTVARFTAQKGHGLLIGAVPAVIEAHPNVKFALVGDGPERDAVNDVIVALRLQSRVLMLGQRTDIADLLAGADLFVLPSHFEGLSLALLEAAAAGIPIVATATGGNVEALGANHAFLVPPDEPLALGAGIIDAIDHPAEAAASAEAARERVHQQFTTERMALKTAAVYRSLLPDLGHRGARL